MSLQVSQYDEPQWAGYNLIANNDFWQRLPAQNSGDCCPQYRTYVTRQRAFVRAAMRNLEQTLRQRGMLINTVDLEELS